MLEGLLLLDGDSLRGAILNAAILVGGLVAHEGPLWSRTQGPGARTGGKMNSMKSYDGDLQMFAEAPAAVSLPRLRFLRWLVEQGRLEHLPAGPPSGSLVEIPVEEAPADGT